MWLQLTIRWLLPRFRYDQIQKLCWKILLPVSLVNVFVTGAAVLLDPSLRLLAWIGRRPSWPSSASLVTAAAAARPRCPPATASHGAAHAAAGH